MGPPSANPRRKESLAVVHCVHSLRELPKIRRSLIELRDEMLNLEQQEADQLREIASEHQLSSRNLVHYVAMRRRDLRELQTQLTDLGMSSIGRSEAYALSSVSRVVNLA